MRAGGGGSFTVEMVGLLQEIHDLCQRQMLTDQTEENALLGLTDINPSTLRIQSTGVGLYELMELGNVDREDLAPLIRLLQ